MARADEPSPRYGRRRLLRLTATSLAGMAVLPLIEACTAPSGGARSAAPTAGSTTTPSISVLRLYGFQNTTGPSADLGIQAQNGSSLAAKQVNAGGGFQDEGGHRYTVEIIPHDVVNATEGIALIRAAAADAAVSAVVGPTNSSFFIPAVPVADQLGIPLIGTGTGAPIPSWSVWAYRVNPVLDTGTPVLLEKVTKK